MDFDVALTPLCQRIEALVPGSVAGVTLCGPDRSCIDWALFPTLPPTFAGAIRAISTQPPYFGSCVQSVATGELITSADIANDSRFDPLWKELCLDHGLRSLQSRPIIVGGAPFGTFVLAFREPRPESDWDVALMKFAADAAGATIQSCLNGGPQEATPTA